MDVKVTKGEERGEIAVKVNIGDDKEVDKVLTIADLLKEYIGKRLETQDYIKILLSLIMAGVIKF